MKSSTSDPKLSIAPFCMPRPKPSSRISMNTPQKTPKAVNDVRSLFWRRVKRISCKRSASGRPMHGVGVHRHDEAVPQEDLTLGLIGDILLVGHDDEGITPLV